MKVLKLKHLVAAVVVVMGASVAVPAYADVNRHLVAFIQESIESADAGLAQASQTTDISVIEDNAWLRVLCSFSVKYFILGVTLQPEVELHW